MPQEIPIYQVDAFAFDVFTGNPAAVCPLKEWLPDATMQRIAEENNLAETAFFVREAEGLRIRWFTPAVEVRLCGHATLASAYVYLRHFEPSSGEVVFFSASGPLPVRRSGDLLVLDFPASTAPTSSRIPETLIEALGTNPLELRQGEDWLVVLPSEKEIRELRPDMRKLAALEARGVIVTAKGKECDFVSRVFVPRAGIDEDHATGSAHTLLIPYWAERLGKRELVARQLSPRGAELFCTDRGDRVGIGGRVFPYLEGTITIPDAAS